jgi:hypothetical protein
MEPAKRPGSTVLAPKLVVAVLAVLLVGMAYLMSPWHGNANGVTVNPHFGFGTVKDVAHRKIYLCVGSMNNCRLLYKQGDKGPRLSVCSTGPSTYRFCGET